MGKLLLILTTVLFWGSSNKANAALVQQDSVKVKTDSLRYTKHIYYQVPLYRKTSATAVVTGKEMVKIPSTTFTNTLGGRVAGLLVSQNSGQPGNEGISLSLRGRTPLLLLDGVVRPLSVLNLEEIETVTILKDAMANAMLGSRAANGAIVVTTKKGIAGKQQITFNAQTSLQRSAQNLYSQPLNSFQYATLYNEAQQNDNRFGISPVTPAYSSAALAAFQNQSDPYLYPDVNWKEQLLKNSSYFSRYSLTANGGNKTARYFVAGEYFNQQGLLNTSDQNNYNTNNEFKGYHIRSNVDMNITSKLTGGIYLLGRILNGNSPGADQTSAIFSSLLSTPNNAYPVFNRDGSLGGNAQYTNNIFGQSTRSGYQTNTQRQIATDFYLRGDLSDLLNGLWVKGKASFTSLVAEDVARSKRFAVFQQNGSTYTQFGTNTEQTNTNEVIAQNRNDYQEFSIGYDPVLEVDHQLSFLLLANRDNLVRNSDLPLTYQGISGHANYSYQDKYIAELGFGYNGSNRYGPSGKNKYALFPAFGLAWNISKENFLKDASWLSNLKISANYGISGGDEAGYYAYLTRYGTTTSAIFGTAAGAQTAYDEIAIGNPNLTYEKTRKANIGVSTSLFRDVLAIEVNYYRDQLYNALIQPGLNSTLLGQDYPLQNIGKYNYSGWEFDASLRKQINNTASYFLSANLTLQQTEVANIAEVNQPYAYMRRTGLQIGQRFGYVAEGLFQSAADIAGKPTIEGYQPQPGDIKYKDQNGDNLINQFDQVAIGNTKPQVFFGLTFGINVKGFDLSALAQGATNRVVNFSGNSFYEFQNTGLGQAYAHHLNRWTPSTAQNATYPRLSLGNNINNQVASTYWLKSGNYIRIKNIELGYTLPPQIISKVKLSALRVFVSGTNLFTIASEELNGVDPEVYMGNYPLQKLATIGVNIKL